MIYRLLHGMLLTFVLLPVLAIVFFPLMLLELFDPIEQWLMAKSTESKGRYKVLN